MAQIWLEKPGRTPILNEARNGLKNRRGTVAMVRLPDAKDGATCQFFINVADNPDLDHKDETSEGYGYCVFGEVLDGMATVEMPSAEHEVRDTPEFDRTPVQTNHVDNQISLTPVCAEAVNS